jgi:hypothetical protein
VLKGLINAPEEHDRIMKTCLIFICFIFISLKGFTQIPPVKDTIVPEKGDPVKQLKDIKADKKKQFKDSSRWPTQEKPADRYYHTK